MTEARISELRPNPYNYNRHGDAQIERLMASLVRFGQPKPIVIWQGTIIAGHGLVQAAQRLGWETLQISDMSETWTEAEAAAYMAADNELAWLSDIDETALAALVIGLNNVDAELAALASGTAERLAELLADFPVDDATGSDEEPGEPEELTRWDVPDAIFATDNDLGIPVLLLDMQATAIVAPVQPWGMGAGARSRQNPGMWHFYTEDYRFDALWTDPSPVVNSGCAAVVEPNFSAYLDMPRAVALWSIYRKRWLARYWQSQGIRVFVDLNVATVHYEDNLLGVPAGWKAWATRGYVERLEDTEREFEMACAHAGTRDITFLVYGGGKAVKERCKQRGWVHIIEQRDAAKETSNV